MATEGLDTTSAFELVDTGWDRVLQQAAAAHPSGLSIVCPFIKVGAIKRLLGHAAAPTLRVITRFNLRDFCDGVSDTEALRLLMERGAKIRGVRNLHAKLYLFGDNRAIVTSANLTNAALGRNHELGFVATDRGIIAECQKYFSELWSRAGDDLGKTRLDQWDDKLVSVRATGARPSVAASLPDEGVDAGDQSEDLPELLVPPIAADHRQSFVKFFGEGHNRASREMSVIEEVTRSGCHWACAYPEGKRPRQAQDGSVIFMARMVKRHNDAMVFGRAIGLRHQEGRDDASEAEIATRPWKKNWPHYVRVHHAEFLSGILRFGVSLNRLMDELGANAFTPTQRNAASGRGNTNPRRAYLQQASVQLTKEGYAWLTQELERAFNTHGKLARSDVEKLDWPAARL